MIPQALSRALRTPPLAPEQFVPTKWNSAKDKADFGNRLLTLIAKSFLKSAFTRSFYERLSNSFGHISHYDSAGFYAHFFESTADKIAFLRETLAHPCYGDPRYTYSDVERAVITRLKRAGILALYEAELRAAAMAAERALLASLEAKHKPNSPPSIPRIQTDLFDLVI